MGANFPFVTLVTLIHADAQTDLMKPGRRRWRGVTECSRPSRTREQGCPGLRVQLRQWLRLRRHAGLQPGGQARRCPPHRPYHITKEGEVSGAMVSADRGVRQISANPILRPVGQCRSVCIHRSCKYWGGGENKNDRALKTGGEPRFEPLGQEIEETQRGQAPQSR